MFRFSLWSQCLQQMCWRVPTLCAIAGNLSASQKSSHTDSDKMEKTLQETAIAFLIALTAGQSPPWSSVVWHRHLEPVEPKSAPTTDKFCEWSASNPARVVICWRGCEGIEGSGLFVWSLDFIRSFARNLAHEARTAMPRTFD